MIKLQEYIERKQEVIEGYKKRSNFQDFPLLDELVALDEKRKALQHELDKLKAKSNALSKSIADCYKTGNREEAESLKKESQSVKEDIKQLEPEQQKVLSDLEEGLLSLPNIPQEIVPFGNDDTDNIVLRSTLEVDLLNTTGLKPHWDLCEEYGLISFELGTKITGAGFPVYLGKGARLQRALIQYFLDFNAAAGYTEVVPPFIVNQDSARGTGQWPDKEGQMYHVQEDGFFLIPTSEIPVTNIYRDTVLQEKELPIKLTAYSPCFRREAGSYGKHVRGLNRLHQFEKVEIVQFTHPNESQKALEDMIAHVEALVSSLGLEYRLLLLCGGDLGHAASITYDFEIYSKAQERWLEVSSISNFLSYQANRLQCRYKDQATKKTELVHTLNGSAMALPRILAGILEEGQYDGGIKLPEVLHAYTGFSEIKHPSI